MTASLPPEERQELQELWPPEDSDRTRRPPIDRAELLAELLEIRSTGGGVPARIPRPGTR